ncbi:MAG: hypothetical protein EBU66_17785 [Bacteroidetes bacterium]|nr:hypothetical protein [bacterium]NBP66483.1 hypothetical protein [Bacteroidota bacterium]
MKNKLNLLFVISFLIVASTLCYAQNPTAFPGADGFGKETQGGRGGSVYYVTNLDCSGEGSLQDALRKPGKKTIVFAVSGVIECSAEILWGDCTIAGQTAPGGIIVRGILIDDFYDPEGKAQNIIIRHVNSRPGNPEERPGRGWVLDDALRLDGARNIMIDHCSFAHAIDECAQVSRSSNISLSNNIFAETLGGHYYLGGMLMNYSTADYPRDSISIFRNAWNRLGGRMPEISCEASYEREGDRTCLTRPFHIEYSNNLLWDIPIQVYYDKGFSPQETERYHDVHANMVQNVAIRRPTYCGPMFNAAFMDNPGNQFFVKDNIMSEYPGLKDYELFYCCNDFCESAPNTNQGTLLKKNDRFLYPMKEYIPNTELISKAANEWGAFSMLGVNGRDQMNDRLMRPIKNNRIDTMPVDGNNYYQDAYALSFTTQPPVPKDTDKDGMPDYWEIANGLSITEQDHNGLILSKSFFGIDGYTNLECYLECLSRYVISGESIAPCGIQRIVSNMKEESDTQFLHQNGNLIRIEQRSSPSILVIHDIMGREMQRMSVDEFARTLDIHLPIGIYAYTLSNNREILESGMLHLND